MRATASLALLALLAGCHSSAAVAQSAPTRATSGTATTNDGGTAVAELAIVIAVGARPHVVLDHAPDPSWGVGLAEDLAVEPGSLEAVQAVDLARTPAHVRGALGVRWELVSESGRCTATLGTPVLVRRAHGWLDDEELDPADPRAAPVAGPTAPPRELWDAAPVVLAAPVVVESGECVHARIAHPIDRPLRRSFERASVDPSLRAAALAAFRALPEHVALAREYRGFLRDEGSSTYGPTWETYGGSDSTTVQRLRARDGRELVVVSAYAELGCGGFGGSLYALFERGPDGLTPRDVGTWADTPIFVLELADRSAPVFIRFEAFRRGDEVEDGRRIWHDASAPWLGCPC